MAFKNLAFFLLIVVGLLRPDSSSCVSAEEQFCKSVSTLVDVSFQLDWKFNAQFAGIFLADHAGSLFDAGVNMEVRPWSSGVNVIDEVAEGRADFACAEQNLIVAAQAEGKPIKAVATMFQFSPYGLMAPPSDDHFLNLDSGLESLVGQEVGVHVDGLNVMALVKGVNDLSNITVTQIPYADKWNRTATGGMAAVQCYVIDEPIGIKSNYGVSPAVLRLSEYGFISTAQTIVVSDDTLATNGEMVTRVLGAIFQGWVETLADKPAAAQIVVDSYVPDDSNYKDVPYQTETLELLEPYVLVDGRDIGVIDPQIWKEAAQLMLEYGIVESLPTDLDSTLATDAFKGPISFEECPAEGPTILEETSSAITIVIQISVLIMLMSLGYIMM